MRWRLIVLSLLIFSLRAQPILLGVSFDDDFSVRRDGWKAATGDWSWKDNKLVQTSAPDGYSLLVRQEAIAEGMISVEGAATKANSSGDGCVGIVCKYVDKDNWVAIRFGAYRGAMVLQRVAGAKEITMLRPFNCELGRRYRCEVRMADGMLLALLDSKVLGVHPDPFAGKAGSPGVFAQSPAAFFGFKMSDDAGMHEDISAAKAIFAGGPRVTHESKAWALEAVDYAVAPLSPTISSPSACTMAIYLRNRGANPARVTDLTLDGKPAAKLIAEERIAWWRAWPETVLPGGQAQVRIKMYSLTLSEAHQIALKSPVGPYQVRVESADAEPFGVEFALDPRPTPLRINFIAFDSALRTLHVYVAATGDLVGKGVTCVEVNGVDVTSRTTPKTATLRADALPLRIELEKPLEPAAPVVVTVRAEGGAFAGHAVRAFPSRFPVQVVILGKQPGPEALKEIANLCFSDVGLCGGRRDLIPDMKRQGLAYFPYEYPGEKSIAGFAGLPERPELTGWWVDEIDGWKKTHRDALEMLRAADEAMRAHGLPIAPYCMNIMAPWCDAGYIELADALSHEYGIDNGIGGLGSFRTPVDFGAPGDISKRELRTARRPWWPYFRNVEAVLLLEPGTKKIAQYYRPIDPREHRLIVYSCLANGAKGALNWNYGVNFFVGKQFSFFSSKHDAVRLNMTALKEREAFGVQVSDDLLAGLKAATHECGRVNAELRLLGPLLSMGDVSDLARVMRSVPEKSVRGGPAAHARAIVCGHDTIVLFAINLNIDSNFNARKPQPVKSYEPVAVDVGLDLPPWLQVADVFDVSHLGIRAISPAKEGYGLHFAFPKLAVAEAIVVTADKGLRARMERELAALRGKLREAGVTP